MKRLIIDIETAPNLAFVWGLRDKYIPIDHIVEPGRTLCWAARWYDSREIMFSSVWGDGSDKMVERVHGLLEEADAVIHYNGKSFDIPMLNREFLLREMAPPEPYHQIDLYKIVRSEFRLPSYKLDFVLREFGIGAKVEHKGMGLWQGCMEGNPKDQRHMEKYNRGDVAPLKELYERLLPWIRVHPNMALYVDEDRPVCRSCGSPRLQKRGFRKTSTQIYQQYQCKSCNSWMRDRVTSVPQERRSTILAPS